MNQEVSIKVNEKRSYPELVHLAFAEEDYVPTEEDWQDYEVWCTEMDKIESERDFMDHYDRAAEDGDIDTDNVLLQFTGR